MVTIATYLDEPGGGDDAPGAAQRKGFGVVEISQWWKLAGYLNVRALFGVALQIPARDKSILRKQSVGAGLRLGRIENELSLAAFLPHRVIAGNYDLSEGLATTGDAIAEYEVIGGIGQQSHKQEGGEPDEEDSRQKTLNSGPNGGAHGEPLYRRGSRRRFAAVYTCVDNTPLPQANYRIRRIRAAASR